jgi:hypothetical protein
MSEMHKPCGRTKGRLVRAASFPILVVSLLLPPASCPFCCADGQSPALPDPIPLRRVLVSPERLPFEMQRTGQGLLTQMTRADFEAQVTAAARATEALKNPPRLVEAHYRARLVDTALVGTAQCVIANPSSAAGILPLQPFNLALRQARINNRQAILGDLLDGKFGLWVEGASPKKGSDPLRRKGQTPFSGSRTLCLSWSARGDLRPGGLQFELKLPSCVLSTIELELPADRTAMLIGDNGLLFGPQPASRADRRLWRLFCSGAPPIDLLIRQTSAAHEPPPLVMAHLKTTQKLAPDRVEADYDFNLEVLHGSIHELLCEGDPALHPTAVSIGTTEIETWEVRPGPTPHAPFRLWIGLPERFQGLLPLRIHCLASAAVTDRWTSPALRLKNAVFQGERLQLQIAAELRLEDWRAGGFELTKAAVEPNGGQTLTLESGLAEAGPKKGSDPLTREGQTPFSDPLPRTQRPSARLRVQEPEFRTRQMAWWQIGPDSSSLTVQIDYEMVRGRLFRLPVLLPADWSVDRVDSSPPDLLRNWTPMPSVGGQTLLIAELQRPLEMPSSARLMLQLRPAKTWPAFTPGKTPKPAEFSVPFPEIHPQGTRLWEGALAIRIDPLYDVTIHSSLPAAGSKRGLSLSPQRDSPLFEPAGKRKDDSGARSEEASEPPSFLQRPLSSISGAFPSPWGNQPPDYLYPFWGQGVRGKVGLRPRSPHVRARCTSEIVLASGRAAVLTRLLLQPEVGSPDHIDLLVSTAVTGKWNWRCEGSHNAVAAMQRFRAVEYLTPLLSLGASTPLSAASLIRPLFGRANWWRLTLAQPLREPLLLETTFDLAVGTNDQHGERWEVPLLGVLSAQPMDGEVQLYLAGTGRVDDIKSEGLTEVAATPGAGISIPWHTFRYSRLPVSLVLIGRITAPDHPAAASVEQAHLATYVQPAGPKKGTVPLSSKGQSPFSAGRLLNYFTFQIRNWKQGTLPLRLPAGARFLAAKLNGRWLAPFRVDETDRNAPVVQLPVAADSPVLGFEVVYALDYLAGTLWSQIHAPQPGLPVRAVASSRTWCLPAGWTPLDEGRYLRHPGPNPDSGDSGLGKAMSLPWFSDPAATFYSDEWRHRQERLLAEADTFLKARRRENKQRSLGQALHDLVYYFFKDQEVLVVDAVALQDAGLWPGTVVGTASPAGANTQRSRSASGTYHTLDDLGLVCIPCRPAPLLTTQRQWAAWQGWLGRTDSVSDSIETAVAAAIANDHDPSGRFWNAAAWLRDGARERPETARGIASASPNRGTDATPLTTRGADATPLAFLPHPEPWTEWEPIAGEASNETLVVLRQDALWGVSSFLTGALLLVWWWSRRRWPRVCYAVALCWFAGGILGLLWLPAALRVVFWWPMLAGVALAAGWYLVSALRPRKPVLSTEMSAVATSVLALALTAGLPGQAAAPAPSTVWFLPGPANAPENLRALVPLDLLSQLKALALRGAAGLHIPVVLGAKYEGTVANGTADFQAEFQVHCFTEDRALLALPLAGVELQEAFLDGSAAYPAALAAPQTGYGIALEGRGLHTIRIHFLARLVGTGEDREVRFSIPELAQNQLSFLAPVTARYLRALSGRGAQQIHADPKGVRLEADLGRLATLAVHWRQEPGQPPPPSVRVQEAYYWDLQQSGSRLLGLLDYHVSRGALAELTIALPENLEVRMVELGPTGTGGLWPRLKDWTVAGTGSQRRLRLEFQVPVTNQVQVWLELVPRLPLTHRAVLSLPAAQGVSFGEGWLAFRASGLSSSITESRGLEEVEPKLFERHWESAATEYPGLPQRAYHYIHASADVPFLRLDLVAPPPQRECLQDLTWFVGPQQAQLRATAKLKAPLRDLALVEWEIPAEVMVADVRGPEIRGWSRTASRLQVWLQRSTAETTLELTGWLVQPASQPAVPFRLPCLAFPGAAPHRTSVHLIAEKGWALQAEKLNNLEEMPEAPAVDRELNFRSQETCYQGVFRLHPAAAPADLQSMSWIEVRDHRLAFRATLDYRIGPRTPRKLTIRLRNWKGDPPHLDVPRRIQAHEEHRDPASRTWVLDLPPDLSARSSPSVAKARKLTCQLTGTLTLDSNSEVTMPEVSVEEAASSDSWLALLGPGLRAEEQRGLVAVADAASAVGRWSAVADSWRRSGGFVWKTSSSDWRLRLRTDPPLVESSPARLLFEEQAAAVLDGRRWLHQATYWLYQEAGTHLGILLPHGATLTMATLDGSEITPLEVLSDRLWLPLTGNSGLRALRLRWVFHGGRESVDRPRLERPLLKNLLTLPDDQRNSTVWTVHIPAGYRLDYSGAGAIQGNQVELLLGRTAALSRAIQLFVQHPPGSADKAQRAFLLAAQTQFDRYGREAEYELALPERLRGKLLHAEELDPRLRKLRAENRDFLRAHQLDPIRSQAESRAASYLSAGSAVGGAGADPFATAEREELLGKQGTPTYWQVGEDPRAVPQIRLIAIEADQRRQALGYSALLLILLVLACILPAYPRAVSWLWSTWPEQLLLLGGLIWLLRGADVVAAFLILLGVIARLFYLGHWIAARFRRPAAAGAGSGVSSAS